VQCQFVIFTSKSILDKNYGRTVPLVLLLIHSGIEAILAVAIEHISIYNKRE
jgi:hypothetical protein